MPSFLSVDAQKDLGMLVILEHILTGERFAQYSNHLSAQDRQAAKSLLENQRSVLQQRVQNHLDAAYGLEALSQGSLDTTHDMDANEHFASLWPGFAPQPPVAANLAGAMQHLLSQGLEHEFPAAPHFETEVKSGVLKKVYELVLPATETADGRSLIENTQRPLLRKIANPLLLGDMGIDATYFVLEQHWKTHFARKAAETGSPMDVKHLRRWIDDPRPMGLPQDAENLVILLFAAQTGYTFYRHGGPYEPTLQVLPDDCELRKVNLPGTDVWEPAVKRAGSIFGVAGHRLLSAGNVGTLAAEVKKKADQMRRACETYRQKLHDHMACMGLTPEDTDRMKTALATEKVVGLVAAAEPANVIGLLARAEIATSEAAMGECAEKASELEGNLETAGWEIFEAIGKLDDERKATAAEILTEVRQALAADEHVMGLAPALKGAHARAVRLLTKPVPTPSQPPVVQPPVTPPLVTRPPIDTPRPKDKKVVGQGVKQDLALPDARHVLSEVERQIKAGQAARINVSWVIEEGGSS